MKTTFFLAAALAAFGLAAPAPELAAREESNVHIGINPRFIGQETNIAVTIGECEELPQDYQLRLTSISPNGILKCLLYSGPGCTGVTPVDANGNPLYVDREVQDLAQPPYNFDNRAFSLLCERK